jgi:ribosomal protein S18 acetylase RimI-like enzyme
MSRSLGRTRIFPVTGSADPREARSQPGPTEGATDPAGHFAAWRARATDGRDWRVRILAGTDFPRLVALHALVVQGLAPGLLVRESDDFLRRHLGPDGMTFAIERDGTMAAYGVLGLRGPEHADVVRRLGLKTPPGLALLDGVGVDTDARGLGLHRMLIRLRIAEAARLGILRAAATVSPKNERSARNLLAEGLLVRARTTMFAGYPRFIVLRTPDDPPGCPATAGVRVPLDDATRQEELLAAGYAGVAIEAGTDGASVVRFVHHERRP